MRAFCLEASTIIAHELYAANYDVIVCSYEFVETSGRDLLKFGLLERVNDILPKRPRAALHSALWKPLGIPFKRMVLDEAQLVKKRTGARHKALLRIPHKAVIMLSGTFAHNKWHNISGYLDLVKGHPFDTHGKVMRFFSSSEIDGRSRLTTDRRTMLQRLLLAFCVARPSAVLQLKNCRRRTTPFELTETEAAEVSALTAEYLKAISRGKEKMNVDEGDRSSEFRMR